MTASALSRDAKENRGLTSRPSFTRLGLAYTWFDNSSNNPSNPDPQKTIHWGDQSWDEMNVGFLEVAFDAGNSAEVVVLSSNSTVAVVPAWR